jgi:hypothetical protein
VIDADVLADTVLRDEAAQALGEFAREHGCPVGRSQVEGLRQVAANQPGELRPFADHQREKAARRQQGVNPNSEKYARLGREVAFWDLVVRLCGSTSTPPGRWSLQRLAEEMAPVDCRAGQRPHGSAPPEEHRAYREARQRAEAWRKARLAADYPAFFQRFCAHYLYLLGKQESDDQRGEL